MFWEKIQHFTQGLGQSKAQKKPQTAKQRIGQDGERIAATYLQKQGMRILQHNWRHASLEIDIIAEDAQGILFVEVKTRKKDSMASPLDGVHYKKRKTLQKAAHVWLSAHDAWEKPCRFAVVAVTYEEHPVLTYKVEFYDNAFDFSPTPHTTMGGGNAPWQPW